MATGALVIQIKEANQRVQEILEPIHHPATYLATVAERALLASLAGGCLAPIGSWGRFEADGELSLGGGVLSDAGGKVGMITALMSSQVCNSESATSLGCEVAEKLLSKGAQELLDLMREGGEPPH